MLGVVHFRPKCAPPAHTVPKFTIRSSHSLFSVITNIHDLILWVNYLSQKNSKNYLIYAGGGTHWTKMRPTGSYIYILNILIYEFLEKKKIKFGGVGPMFTTRFKFIRQKKTSIQAKDLSSRQDKSFSQMDESQFLPFYSTWVLEINSDNDGVWSYDSQIFTHICGQQARRGHLGTRLSV